MGGDTWHYFIPYTPDILRAVRDLQSEEFRAGRYRFSEGGAETIEEALENAEGDTASILNVQGLSTAPDFDAIAPIPSGALLRIYGTDKPSRQQLEKNMSFFEEIDRGQALYILVYEGGTPKELLFAGYSYD